MIEGREESPSLLFTEQRKGVEMSKEVTKIGVFPAEVMAERLRAAVIKEIEDSILQTQLDQDIQQMIMGHGEWLLGLGEKEICISGPVETPEGASWDVFLSDDERDADEDQKPLFRFRVKKVEIEIVKGEE